MVLLLMLADDDPPLPIYTYPTFEAKFKGKEPISK
jgi:hypothetical protein